MPRLFNPYQYLKADFDPSEIKVIDLPNDATFSPRAYMGIDQLSRRLPPEETQAIAKAWKQTLDKESLVDDTILSVRFLNRTDGLCFHPINIRFGKQPPIKIFMPNSDPDIFLIC